MIKLTIPGKPLGKQRPKFTSIGKFGRAYTPKETVNYEAVVRSLFITTYPLNCHQPFKGAVASIINAFYPIPQSKSKKIKLAMEGNLMRPTVKPDNDNVEKVMWDALQGLAFVDDKQVVDNECHKWYSKNPRVEITINELL